MLPPAGLKLCLTTLAGFDKARTSWLDLAMKTVKIAALKDRLSEHLRAVEAGDEVVVTDRNRPIARIVSVESKEPPALTVDAPTVSFKTVRTKKWRATGWRLSAEQLLSEERRER